MNQGLVLFTFHAKHLYHVSEVQWSYLNNHAWTLSIEYKRSCMHLPRVLNPQIHKPQWLFFFKEKKIHPNSSWKKGRVRGNPGTPPMSNSTGGKHGCEPNTDMLTPMLPRLGSRMLASPLCWELSAVPVQRLRPIPSRLWHPMWGRLDSEIFHRKNWGKHWRQGWFILRFCATLKCKLLYSWWLKSQTTTGWMYETL